jgi:hypothetical protein
MADGADPAIGMLGTKYLSEVWAEKQYLNHSTKRKAPMGIEPHFAHART